MRLTPWMVASPTRWAGGYETLAVALSELHRLRRICQTGIAEGGEAMFPFIQDKDTLKKVVEASRSEEFWVWISAAHKEIFTQVEDTIDVKSASD